MAHVLIRHRVTDYAQWKKVFDDFADTRRDGGEKSYQVFQLADDPNDLTLVFEWDNKANAEKFLSSGELKSAMQRAGVAEEPNIRYVQLDDKGAL